MGLIEDDAVRALLVRNGAQLALTNNASPTSSAVHCPICGC
jgi:hypothetical protein